LRSVGQDQVSEGVLSFVERRSYPWYDYQQGGILVYMYIVIFVTASNKKEAQKIAAGLIKQRLAACVNIIDKVDSLFCWEAKVQKAEEFLLIIKSKREKLGRIIKLVKSLHSYTVPEIIALPIIAGDKPYLRWIDAALR
jgi:periplasmic divalent cation tolerance protein